MIRRDGLALGVFAIILGVSLPTMAAAQTAPPPPMPNDVPVLLPGDPVFDTSRLQPYRGVRFAVGRAGKVGPLGFGEAIDASRPLRNRA